MNGRPHQPPPPCCCCSRQRPCCGSHQPPCCGSHQPPCCCCGCYQCCPSLREDAETRGFVAQLACVRLCVACTTASATLSSPLAPRDQELTLVTSRAPPPPRARWHRRPCSAWPRVITSCSRPRRASGQYASSRGVSSPRFSLSVWSHRLRPQGERRCSPLCPPEKCTLRLRMTALSMPARETPLRSVVRRSAPLLTCHAAPRFC